MIPVVIALGALLGAPARYLVSRAMQSWQQTGFPWGTLAVNVVASLILGGLTAAKRHLSPTLLALAGVGFAGSLSTYSTFSYETMRLGQDGARRHAAANVLVDPGLGIGAATLAWWLVRAAGR